MKQGARVELPIWFPDNELLSPDVLFAVTTREGGRSKPPFDSLNLSYTVGDEPKVVTLNRRRVARALKFNANRLVAAQQVHSDAVAIVVRGDAGRGARDYASAIPATDALVTNVRELPLALFVADCAPVFLFDPRRRVIALAHVGWRGATAGLLLRTIEAMMWSFQCEPRDLVAVVGPHIGACCYEVGDEVASEFRVRCAEAVRKGHAKPLVSLANAIRHDLVTSNISASRIVVDPPCTKCNSSVFFSHRASGGRTGRMMAVAMMSGTAIAAAINLAPAMWNP